jgi:hypothetical protein
LLNDVAALARADAGALPVLAGPLAAALPARPDDVEVTVGVEIALVGALDFLLLPHAATVRPTTTTPTTSALLLLIRKANSSPSRPQQRRSRVDASPHSDFLTADQLSLS